jgi:hypothetical protein
MAFDRTDWHNGSADYPADLPPENGGTHIGMFLAWIILHDLHGEIHREEMAEEVEAVKRREMTGRDFLERACDEKFWRDDLNDAGNDFARRYYSGDSNQGDENGPGQYHDDYDATLAGGLPTVYHVEDTWGNYDRLAPVIDRRYAEWLRRGKQPWWRFWK